MPRMRREYATDHAHLIERAESAVERIRQDRLLRGLSAVALSRLANVSVRTIKYHEERNTSDDSISTAYLKQIAQAMRLPSDHYLDDYLLWGDSKQYMQEVSSFLHNAYDSLEHAYQDLGVHEYAVTSWRVGRKRPPRWVYNKIKEFNKKGAP